MKKLLAFLSVILIMVALPSKAEVNKRPNKVFEYQPTILSDGDIQSTFDHLVYSYPDLGDIFRSYFIVTKVDNVAVSSVNDWDVGGSFTSGVNIVNGDSYAISNKRVNYGIYLLSMRKHRKLLATNDIRITNSPSVQNTSDVNDVGKSNLTYRV